MEQSRSLGAVISVLEAAYPVAWAEDWDRSGLVVGDAAAHVRHVHLAVDPTIAVVREAVAAGAQLLVTHHPLLLRGASFLPESTGKGAVLADLIRGGTALWCGHTNVDRSSRGTVGAWIAALGLQEPRALASGGEEAAEHGSRMLGLGAIGTLAEPTTVAGLAEHIASFTAPTAQGVRYTGEGGRLVERVAVCPGAGDSFLDLAAGSGADVYITSDLRHHPALEHLESGADPAAVPALIDVAHSASEALWLPHAADLLQQALPGIEVTISGLSTDPWSGRAG